MTSVQVLGGKGPRDYIEVPCRIPPEWRVLDIGPGRYPFQRANVYVDHNPEMLEGLSGETILAQFHEGLPQIQDKSFDLVWCSHVMEHVENPTECAATLSRIAHRGMIVVPSAIKESIFNLEEYDHKWLIERNPRTGAPIFIRHHKATIQRIRDIDVQKITCRLYRSGTAMDTNDDQYLREWFSRTDPYLDIAHYWEGELKLQVIE